VLLFKTSTVKIIPYSYYKELNRLSIQDSHHETKKNIPHNTKAISCGIIASSYTANPSDASSYLKSITPSLLLFSIYLYLVIFLLQFLLQLVSSLATLLAPPRVRTGI
jgi:hypothetical protein